MRYAIVIENAGSNYSAYVPDLPGCIATGETVAETERMIREAIEFHLEGLRATVPPTTVRGQHLAQIEGGVTEDELRFKRGPGVNRSNRNRFAAGGAVWRTARIVCRALFTGCDPEV